MPLLRTDDEAKHVPSVWLGPPDVIRWPFDASFTQWVIGFALCPVLFFLFGFVVPVGLWLAVFVWIFPRNIARKFPRRVPGFVRSPWFLRSGLILLTVLIYAPSWFKPLFLPMNPFAAAFPFCQIAAFLIVRKVSKYVTPMTPVLYWFSVLVELLRRPRERAAQSYSMTDRVVSESPEDEEFTLADLPDYRQKLTLTKD